MSGVKQTCTRGMIYFIGLVVLALGIVLNTKTLLGVSPIISIPYNICQIWHLNLGEITFLFYCVCVLMEALLQGRQFKVKKHSTEDIVNCMLSYPESTRYTVLTPIRLLEDRTLQQQLEIKQEKEWDLEKIFLMLLVFARQESLGLYLQDIS